VVVVGRSTCFKKSVTVYLSLSFDSRLMQFSTYFNILIIVTSRSRAFCNPPIVFTLRRIFLFLRLYLFCRPSAFNTGMFPFCLFAFRTLSGGVGGGVMLFLLVTVFR